MKKKISLLTLIVVMIAFVSCKQASKNAMTINKKI